MKWTILNTLICPQSGIAFSAISSLRFLKFIMWYEADVILLPGESMKLYSSRVLINDQYHSLKIYNITVYDEAQWEKLRERPSCPYHAGGERSDSCFYQSFCAIKRCPNNIPRSEPWRYFASRAASRGWTLAQPASTRLPRRRPSLARNALHFPPASSINSMPASASQLFICAS